MLTSIHMVTNKKMHLNTHKHVHQQKYCLRSTCSYIHCCEWTSSDICILSNIHSLILTCLKFTTQTHVVTNLLTHIHIYSPSDTQAFIYLPKISHITLVSKYTPSLIHTRVITNSLTFQTCSLCVNAQTYTFIYSCKFLVININIVTNIIAHKHAHTDLEAHKFTHLYKNSYIYSHMWTWITLFQYTVAPWTTRVSLVWVHSCADFFQ